MQIKERPFTSRRLAILVGVPPWTIRRLERRGVLPCAPRKFLSRERYWYPSDLPELRRRLDEWKERAAGCDSPECRRRRAAHRESSDPSNYVQQEVGYALGLKKLVVPLVERGTPPDALAMLGGIEFIRLDFRSPEQAFRGWPRISLGFGKERSARTKRS